ncbi:MAG: DUF1328 domain-containing protein [Pseudomonadota bacterium]
MKHWTLIFLVLMLISAPFGFAGISATSEDLARILFGFFALLFVAALIGWVLDRDQ